MPILLENSTIYWTILKVYRYNNGFEQYSKEYSLSMYYFRLSYQIHAW